VKFITSLTVCLVFFLSLIQEISGHGYMSVPAARNAMWKCGFPSSPPDYDLTGLSAGGPAIVRGQKLGLL